MGGTSDGRYAQGGGRYGVALSVSLLLLTVGVVGVSPALAGAEPELRRELEALERSFKQFHRKLDFGKRTWKREDLYVRS